MKKYFIALISFFSSLQIFPYGTGISTHPIDEKQGLITTEFTSFFSKGSGAGMQARYTTKLFSNFTAEAGFGFSNGARSNRLFLAGDIEILPDYDRQPRFSTKVGYENANEFNGRHHIFSATPLVSKGIAVNTFPLYPYAGIPIGLTLNSNEQNYKIRTAVIAGLTAKLPFEGTEKMLINAELQVNVTNSFSGILAGVSLPIN